MQREGRQLVDRRYDDLGQSSETLDRPALNRLVEDILSGAINRVLVHRLDRIERKILYACQFLELSRQHDLAITIVSGPELTGDANGRLLITLMASFAEFEQEMTKSRMADARAALKAHGRRVAGRVPHGYFADPTATSQSFAYSSTSKLVKWLIRFAPLWIQIASTSAAVAIGTNSGRNCVRKRNAAQRSSNCRQIATILSVCFADPAN